jgi:catechol 2,3-dioxygenase-like lactoylglutathione lyase family enzyme
MKRLHVHVAVEDLDRSIRFYAALFSAEPTVVKSDYAKWMLDDPRVNFAISTHSGAKPGVDHLGIQVEGQDELQEVYARLKTAEGPVLEEGNTTCCYAQSEKSWIADPQGVAWETFQTVGESTVYGESAPLQEIRDRACCGPAPAPAVKACC